MELGFKLRQPYFKAYPFYTTELPTHSEVLASVAGNHMDAGFLGRYQLWVLSPLQPTWHPPNTHTAFTTIILHDRNIPNCRIVSRPSVVEEVNVQFVWWHVVMCTYALLPTIPIVFLLIIMADTSKWTCGTKPTGKQFPALDALWS